MHRLQRKLAVVGLCAIGFLLVMASSNVSAQTYTDLHDFNCATEGCQPANPQLLAQGRDANLYGDFNDGGTNNQGTVFLVTPSGTAATLYNFDSSTADSISGLTFGTDGNFYGTTLGGGAYEYGSVFNVSPSGTLTTLHSFAASEGSPVAPPIQANNKSFYGVTYGPSDYTAYKISPTGVYKAVTSSGPPYVEAPLLQASNGNFYGPNVSTSAAGDCGSIFEMTAAGAVSIVYSFDTTHGCNPVGPLVQDAKGYLYGTTWSGGSSDLGVVFKLTTKGVITVLHNFNGTNGGQPLAGLVLATDGNFYGGTTISGDGEGGVVFKMTASGDYSVLYNSGEGLQGWGYAPTPMQHTNGKIYGLAEGGAYDGGVLYSLDMGLAPFAKLMTTQGSAGQGVQLLGQGFTGATAVMFGTGSANFTVVSDTYMTAEVPAAGTTGYVAVTTPSGTLTSSQTFKVVPVITSFTPPSGPAGTEVTIKGSGFTGATKVTFGGVEATGYTVDSGTEITAPVPAGAKTGNIVVTTPGGTASKGTFTVS
jgi:uncharacterized repeat protein (TIGR03803 family)